MPPVRFTSVPVPTQLNPLGMKGCGEAGTVGSLAAIANAVADALAQAGAGLPDLPLTPERVWTALQGARTGLGAGGDVAG
jgi:carbon-monoxide dehydrogenase large subunit